MKNADGDITGKRCGLRSSRFSPGITDCHQYGGFPLLSRLYGHPLQDWTTTKTTL